MVIEKITMKSFGKISDLTLDFSEGINVIEGQNESGKSTIAAFIKYMFYGFETPDTASGSDDRPDERKKRLSWETGTASGSMLVRAKGKRYLITRSTVPADSVQGRPAYKEDCMITDIETGAPVFGKIPAGEVFFGVDRELFENTAFFGRVGESAFGEKTVKEAIENILFSGNERLNTGKAIDKLRSKMDILDHDNLTSGVIRDLAVKKEELEETLRQTDEDNKLILIKEAELHELHKKREGLTIRQNKLNDADQCYHNVMLIQTFDRLHELEKENEEKEEVYEKFLADHTKNGFLPDGKYLDRLREARKSVNDAYRDLVGCEEKYARERSAVGITREIEGAIEQTDEVGGENEVLRRAKILHFGMIRYAALNVLSLLAILFSVLFEILTGGTAVIRTLGAIPGGLGIAGAIICTLLFAESKKRMAKLHADFRTENYPDLLEKMHVIAEARKKRDGIIASTDAAMLALNAAEEKYKNEKQRLKDLVLRYADDSDDADSGARLDAMDAEIEAFLTRRKALEEEKTDSDITICEIRRTLSAYSEINVRAQVQPFKRKVLLGINHEDITSSIAEAKADIAALEKLEAEKENELAGLKLRARDPGELYSRIQVLESRIAEQQMKYKAYYLAAKTLEQCESAMRLEVSPRLGSYAADLIGVMTDRKYSDIDVSEGLSVSFLQNGEKRSVDFLSGGARDMTYIAVRMALIDMLYAEYPPVCFDETFANQDNDRARSLMQALLKLDKEQSQQTIIFTCRGREATIAKELDGGSAVYKLTSSATA